MSAADKQFNLWRPLRWRILPTGIRLDQWLSLVLIVMAVGLVGQAWPTQPVPASAPQVSEPQVLVPQVQAAPIPVFVASQAAQLSLSAQSVMVMDEPSGSILYEWQSAESRPGASTTKLMTALVARQTYQLDQVLTVKQESAVEGTTIGLEWGEQLAVRELITGLLVHSGNDAAAVLAQNHPLGEAGFVAEMNKLAGELHLADTHFTNAAGLDDADHYTSARDLALLAKVVMADPFLRDLVSTRITTVTDVTGTYVHELVNTNELLKTDPRVKGIKTGTTEAAGQVLLTQLETDGHVLLIVVMGSQDRYADTTQLINWVLQHYEWRDAP